MIKIEPKFYRIRVTDNDKMARLVCITYNLDAAKQFVGVEYYELCSSFDDIRLNIPYTRQVTFQEELRVLHQAATAYTGNRSNEQTHIEKNLKDAYGSSIQVTFEEIGTN